MSGTTEIPRHATRLGVLLMLAIAPAAWADVVELKTGQRVEGTFRGADAASVRIEIGGQVLTFKPEQVRAIYYGTAPAAAESSARDEALKALKALRSIAQVLTTLTYRDYAPRVSDTRIIVDRYLQEKGGDAGIKGAIAQSMHFYMLAGLAWDAELARGPAVTLAYLRVGSDPAVAQCEPVLGMIADSKATLPYALANKERTGQMLSTVKGPGRPLVLCG